MTSAISETYTQDTLLNSCSRVSFHSGFQASCKTNNRYKILKKETAMGMPRMHTREYHQVGRIKISIKI